MKKFVVYCLIGLSFISQLLSAEEKMIKAVIFDFGGVIAEFDRDEALHYLSSSFDTPKEELLPVLKATMHSLATGEIEEENYWENFAKLLKSNFPPYWMENWIKMQKSALKVNPKMLQLVQALKEQNYLTPLLSNISAVTQTVCEEMGYHDLFDPAIYSFQLGMCKPEYEIFAYTLKKIGLEADECIFIDDRLENVEAAQALGIYSIQFNSYEQPIEVLLDALQNCGIDVGSGCP